MLGNVASLVFRRRCLRGVARVQTWRRRRRSRRSGFVGPVAEEPVDDEEDDDDVGEDLWTGWKDWKKNTSKFPSNTLILQMVNELALAKPVTTSYT